MHQRTAKGKPKWAPSYQNIPISLFSASSSFTKAVSDNDYVVANKDDTAQDWIFAGLMNEQNIQCMVMHSITNREGEVVALITMSFPDHKDCSAEFLKTLDRFVDRAMILIDAQIQLSKKGDKDGKQEDDDKRAG